MVKDSDMVDVHVKGEIRPRTKKMQEHSLSEDKQPQCNMLQVKMKGEVLLLKNVRIITPDYIFYI